MTDIPYGAKLDYRRARKLLNYTPPGWRDGFFRPRHQKVIDELEAKFPAIRAWYDKEG